MTTDPPMVAIPAYGLSPGRVGGWRAGAFAVPEDYVSTLRRAGLCPVIIPGPSPGRPEDLLAPFSGLMLAGGGDVNPQRYGAQPHPSTYGIDPGRDDLELALIPAAFVLGLPVLAICRGMQVLNVACGGTLCQHLPEVIGSVMHGDPTRGMWVPHDVEVAAGSRLAAAVGVGRLPGCASRHHQGIERLGEGLEPVAWGEDGLVEAVERAGNSGWVTAVQWHPEVTAAKDKAQQALFDAFAEQVKARAAR
ncbi:MAG TPA: gamma-glutamyl-gamma-aminobutyrate hydrolase family protein [Candidatus Tectomicrobia bacterium]|nr:gamma-glutamyl-gamma-aminobutyrate hydrolase family protein [Candidatus Tectomicrobia bacterium]